MSQENDYDVIIIGTGVAGHCAALEALDAGARVAMLDSADKIGGSSAHTTGIFMGANTRFQRANGVLDDSPELFFRNYMSWNQWSVQPSVAKRLCYEAGPTVDWLEQLGIEYLELASSGDEERPRGHVTRGGQAIIETLSGRVSAHKNVDVALNSRVTRLVMKDRAVKGVCIDDNEIITASAVIMAMGGMGADLDMIAQWHPAVFWEGAAAPRYVGLPTSRGDAVRLAQQIDAQVVRSRGSRSPFWGFGGGYLPGWMLVVNALGRRFYDEMSSYGVAEVVYASQPGATGYGVFDDATKQAMQSVDDVIAHLKVLLPEIRQTYASLTSRGVDDLVSQGKIIKADSLQALAQRIGVPADNLTGTVERYNGWAAAGHDDDYLKSAKSLRSVATPPFYAFDIHLPLFGLTGAGVRIDHNASVLHRDSRSIPGLFAAGECTGGVLGTMYVGSGNSLANSSTYGRIAGRSAAAYALKGVVPRVDWAALTNR